MSYRVGVGFEAMVYGWTPAEPAIICDGCGLVHHIVARNRMGPPAWFFDGKAPPKWKLAQSEHGTRQDFCPRCKL